MLEILEIQHLN